MFTWSIQCFNCERIFHSRLGNGKKFVWPSVGKIGVWTDYVFQLLLHVLNIIFVFLFPIQLQYESHQLIEEIYLEINYDKMFVSFAKNPIGSLLCLIPFCWIWIYFPPLLFYTSASCGCSKKCCEYDDDSCLRSSDEESCSCNFKDLLSKKPQIFIQFRL